MCGAEEINDQPLGMLRFGRLPHMGLTTASSRLPFMTIGLGLGIIWWLANPFGWTDAGERVGAHTTAAVLVSFASAAGLLAQFTWTGRDWARWILSAAGVALVIAVVTWQVWSHQPTVPVDYRGDGQRIGVWILGACTFLYIAAPFAQIYQDTGRLRFPYPGLFEHSWTNVFVLLTAALFAGAVWTLLAIWTALFQLLNVSFFRDVFFSPPFAYLATFTVLGYGCSVGRMNESVIRALRRITLMGAYALLPLVALIALLFAGALPVRGLTPLWETGRATPLLLTFLAAIIVLTNAVFEDGASMPRYARVMRIGIEASVLVTPGFAVIAAYGTWLRIDQYGLSPDRVYALLLVLIALLYTIGYAVSVVWRTPPWIGGIQRVNVAVAIVIAGLALAVQLPPLDPLRLSALDQAERLRTQRTPVSEFDFASLRFKLGRYGWEELSSLRQLPSHPDAEVISAAVDRVLLADSYWSARRAPVPSAASEIRRIPSDLEVTDEFLARMLEQSSQGANCVPPNSCAVLGADLDHDGLLELCLISLQSYRKSWCYVQGEAGEPRSIGQLLYSGANRQAWEQALEALSDSPIAFRRPRYDSIVVHGSEGVFEFYPED